MARKASVILTPTEQKAAVAANKALVKDLSAQIKTAKKELKSFEADHTAAVKIKTKAIAALEKQLTAAQGSVATPSPTT